MADQFADLGFQPQPAGGGHDDLGFVPESKEEQAKRLEAEKYDKPLAAGAAGIARGASFGLSDVAAKGLGFGDELAKLKEYNPKASLAGEVTGAVGGAFVGPGAILAKAGTAAGKRLATSIIAQRAAAAAMEGAVYGAGQTVSEVGLSHDVPAPEHVAESLLANVSVGALLGGGFSLGMSGAEAGGSALSKKILGVMRGGGKAVEGAEAGVADAGIGATEGGASTGSGTPGDPAATPTPPQENETFLDKMMNFAKGEREVEKPNISQIRNAAYEENVPLTQGQQSGSKLIQDLESSLEQTPTFFGSGVRKEVEASRAAIGERAKAILDDATTLTADEAGQRLRGEVDELFKREHSAITEKYNSLRSDFQNIKLGDPEKAEFGKTFFNSDIAPNPNGSEAKIAAKWAEELQYVKNLDQLKTMGTKVGNDFRLALRTGDTNSANMLGHIKDQVNKLREFAIENAALEATANGADAAAVSADTIKTIRATDSAYAQLNKKATQFADEMGLGKVNGIKKLYEKLDGYSNEQLVKKLFNENDAGSMRYFQKNFPQQFETLRKYKLGEILKASLVQDQVHVPSLLRNTKSLSPEARRMMFGPQGARTLNNLKTLHDAFPKMVGPSGTQQAISLGNLLNPFLYKADAVKLAFLKGSTYIQRAVSEENSTILSHVKGFLDPAARTAKGAAIAGGLSLAGKSYQSRLDNLAELASNPDKLSDKLASSTKGLQDVDTNVHSALTASAVSAVQFLQAKAPKIQTPPDMFGGEEKTRPSDAALAKWNRYVKAVDKPLSILEDMRHKILTPESVEAVKTVYPKLYEKIQQQTIETVSKTKRKLTFQEKTQLSILLGMPVSSAARPDFIKAMQEGFAAPEDDMSRSPSSKPGPSVKGLNQADPTQTGVERILKR